MPAIPVGSIWVSKIGCYMVGQAGLNLIHWVCTTNTGAGGTDTQFAISLDALLAPLLKPMMPSIATYYGVGVQQIWPLPLTALNISAAHTGVGSGGLAPVPPQVSGIITMNTGLAGRANRGRVYVPFPAAAFVDGTLTTPTGAYQILLTAVFNALATPITITVGGGTSVMTPGVYHRTTHAVSAFTTGRVNPKWATQRRRGNYGRANPYPPF